MYQSFSGNSRRPRQVNLSGRNTNPFAAANATPAGPQQAIQSAHQDRQQRQQQRQQLNAAKLLQKTWRGHTSRRNTKDAWRKQWDAAEQDAPATAAYSSPAESLARLKILLLFYSPNQSSDVHRLIKYTSRQKETIATQATPLDQTWRQVYLRLETSCLAALSACSSSEQGASKDDPLLRALAFVASEIPEESASIALEYYSTLAKRPPHAPSIALTDALYAPLGTKLLPAYEGFIAAYLTLPHDTPDLLRMTLKLDLSLFTQAAANVSEHSSLSTRNRLWLLGQYIYIVHRLPISNTSAQRSTIVQHVPTIARLLASLAEEIAPEASLLDMENRAYDQEVLVVKNARVPLNKFLQEQLQRLVDQNSIRSLLARPEADPTVAALDSTSDSTQLLAGYAVTLLRMFPLRADDIRMWLYLGPSGQARSKSSIPAIAYFWRGARKTNLFEAILRDPRAALDLLTAAKPPVSCWQPPNSHKEHLERAVSDWRVMVVFLELYTFVLKIMDDEEFLGGDPGAGSRMSHNALPLSDIKDLTLFLKNLGFAMYYHAQDISNAIQPGSDMLSSASLSRHFGGPAASTDSEPEPEPKPQQQVVAGITGMSVEYLKGLVTGLLRAVYERDSRRQFLPKGHWLMTSRFDMSNFIQAVVGEEQRRRQLQQQDDDDVGDGDDSDLEPEAWILSNSGREQNRHRRMERDQRRASRKRYLQVVAPKLEILQNMPFLIPFETRVEVFREFVRLDQIKRRGGYTDSDTWRHMIMFGIPDGRNELNRHHAIVRRKHEFEDAFNAFYPLGPGLKEPIQITFKDEFDIVEAGIDGGGVTKEFLTSVTSQAFNPSSRFFKENPQHLLYPNPTRAEELKDETQTTGVSRDEAHAQNTHLMRQYEFLGRVVGKCLYEGILIDIAFAGFFLTQWSLFKAGPSGQSAYRPTINDLRDLDEGLYKGLLDLKYYPGNVEEDIPLTFTVNDEVVVTNGKSRTIENELTPGGSDQPVTNENRLLYISLMARWRLVRQSYRQTAHFLRGLSSIIEPGWLSMFNQLELQTLIGGAATQIDVADLRRNTYYNGVYAIGDDGQEHDSVKLFWEVMESISDEDRRKVLKFVTSTPRAPLLGFGSLNPQFTLRDSGADESRFPTASTCVNLLKLPRYTTASTLREKLLYAVNSGAGFDLS